jgi:lysophospholipid acyltransferase (LPLAT)-like uncharacterized protein
VSSSPVSVEPASQSASKSRAFTWREKVLLWIIRWAGYLAIALICRTLRYSISLEDESIPANTLLEKPGIYSFWHRCVFPAAWMWKDLGIAVMVSRSFDGEYIARVIEKFGFVAVRGSSSRGGAEALLGMKAQVERGAPVAFTIDGPRGPKYVAKPGPVRLSKVTGIPMTAFYVALSDAWVLRTWDEFMIPKPFSRALVRGSRKMMVPSDADETQMADYHAQLQAALDRVTKFAEENVARVGSKEFPLRRRQSPSPMAGTIP